MTRKRIYYKQPVFRPPSEGRSLLIQATEGCTYHCAFCVSNLGKNFKVRKIDDIKEDLNIARNQYGADVRRIFFLDGNAMVMPYEKLLEITKYAKSTFKNLERVSVYAHAKDILEKSIDQLKELSNNGLKMAYIGIETGNNDLLKEIGKRTTREEIVNAFHKCFKSGITPSGTIILGLAGNDPQKSKEHALDTAKLISEASPVHVLDQFDDLPTWYISALTLMIPPGTDIHKDMSNGKLIPMNPDEILNELLTIIENLTEDVQNCTFRSNHASNYLAIKGVLIRDKEKIIQLIKRNQKDHRNIRPEFLRGL